MGQKRITVELTEYQARILRYAVIRAHTVAPTKFRTRMFSQKIAELRTIVEEATRDLPELGTQKGVMHTQARTNPAYVRRDRRGRYPVK